MPDMLKHRRTLVWLEESSREVAGVGEVINSGPCRDVALVRT